MIFVCFCRNAPNNFPQMPVGKASACKGVEILPLFDFIQFPKRGSDFLKADSNYVVKWLEYAILCVATKLSGSAVEVGSCS